jgi:putative redox protein
MKETVDTNWLGNMAFESDIEGFKIKFDADEKNGGTQRGPRPKPVLLGALAGCTGMDIVSILAKKKVPVESFRISISGEIRDEYPKYYEKIHLLFELTGSGFENNPDVLAKVKRAIQLSRDNYCAISAMLKNSCEMSEEVILRNSR